MHHPEAGLDHAKCRVYRLSGAVPVLQQGRKRERWSNPCRASFGWKQEQSPASDHTECRKFFPKIVLFSEVSVSISPAVCTHCIQRNTGHSFSPTRYCFSDPLKATCVSAAQHNFHVMAWKGGEQAGGKNTFSSLTEATFHCRMAPVTLAGGFHALLPGLLQGFLICPCGCLTLVTW